MLYAQDVLSEDQLSFERRTGLMVRRIQNMLAVNPRGFILKEMMHKQGEKINKNTSERLCTLDAEKLQWFHDDHELQTGKYLGSIELRFVYSVLKSYQEHNTRPAFMLGVTMYRDKTHKEVEKKREFFFSCADVLTRDKWMIAIEFLKTKAVYDAYAAKNSNVNFATTNLEKEEEQNHEEEHRMDMASLLYDFGTNLKSETKYVVKNNNNLAANMGNMAQALATMQKSESFSKNPRMSVLRQ